MTSVLHFLSSTAFTVLANVFALGLVIFIHEGGHYIACLRLGVRVEKFAFGFGPELIGVTGRSGTRFSLCAVPFGGFVKPAGEDPATDAAITPKADEYFGQSWYRRLVIVYAGPTMNYVLAFLLYSGLILAKGTAVPSNEAVIGNMMTGFPADAAGFQIGDRVTSFDGRALAGWDDLASSIHRSALKPVTLTVQRGAQTLNLTVTPRKDDSEDRGVIGITPEVTYKPATFREAVTEGASLCWQQTKQTVTTIAAKVWHRQRPDLAGPVGIFQMVSRAARAGWEEYLFFIGFISVAIGFFNFLPFPLLDGGHGAVYFWEGIRGKRPAPETLEKIQTVGFAFLLSLLAFATYNDVLRIRTERAAKAASEAKAATLPAPSSDVPTKN
jgi:regulator of sigma E protease